MHAFRVKAVGERDGRLGGMSVERREETRPRMDGSRLRVVGVAIEKRYTTMSLLY